MSRFASTLAGLWLLASGCGGGRGDGGGPQPLTGKVAGASPPASGKVVVLWEVSATSPDYVFKFGEGTSQGQTFTISVDGGPPAEALNNGAIGVGVLLIVDQSLTVPEGKLMSLDAIRTMIRGASLSHALIWKNSGAQPMYGWDVNFPDGLSCGQCAPAPAGSRFNQWQKEDCGDLTIDITTSLVGCNWT